MERSGPKFNETDVYRIRKSSKLNQGLFLCKLILKKHGHLNVEGMGECISLVVKTAQILVKNDLAVIQTIREENIEFEGRKEINPKVTITLKKSTNFDKLTEDIILRDN
jgi:hypothetical protein